MSDFYLNVGKVNISGLNTWFEINHHVSYKLLEVPKFNENKNKLETNFEIKKV